MATTGQPATLDGHFVAQRTIGLIDWNMFEALFTFDAEYNTVPMLAEGIEVSDDGLVNKITLRQGVPFHNGEEMRAADVVASFNRWAPVASLGLAISQFLEEIVEVDPYAVEIRLTSPLVALPSLLARQQSGTLDPSQGDHGGRGVRTDDARAVHRHGALQVRRVPAGPLHAARPLRRLRRGR